MFAAFHKIKRPLYEKRPGVEFSLSITEDSETVSMSYLSFDVENGETYLKLLSQFMYSDFESNEKCGSNIMKKRCLKRKENDLLTYMSSNIECQVLE